MATSYSNANGQVVEARDARGTYYYLADSLGTPTCGYWLDRDAAIANLELGPESEETPDIDGEIYEDGTRVPSSEPEPPIATGYVLTNRGDILVQVPDDTSRWGFYLASEDQGWDGGFGVATEWELLDDDDPRITDADRERLSWIFEES